MGARPTKIPCSPRPALHSLGLVFLFQLFLLFGSAGRLAAAQQATVLFDSGTKAFYAEQAQATALSAGTTAAGDGYVVELGYYDQATPTNKFLGNWVALSGESSANTAFKKTSIGDEYSEGAGEGTLAISLTFVSGSNATGKNLPSAGTPLALRFYNSGSIAAATKFNVVACASWLWQAPATAPADPVLPLSLDDANLEWLGGAASAFYTSQSLGGGDTIAPVLTLPGTQTVEATGGTGAVVNYPAATATDAGTPNPTIAYSKASGTIFPLGTTVVTVTATDAANNTSTGTFNVVVQDTTAPTLNLPANQTAEATSAAGAVVNYPAATASDAVTTSPTITYSKASGTTFPLGTTVVTVTATDAANKSSSGTFNVTVRDLTAPVLTAPAGGFKPLTLSTGLNGVVALPDYAAQVSANDSVGLEGLPTQVPAPGSSRSVGPVHVVLTARDAAGNVGTLAFDVVVTDGTAPVLIGPLGGFTPLNVSTDGTGTAALPDFTAQATATDNVAVSTAISQMPAPGTMYPVGAVPVTLSAADALGNVGTIQLIVNVNDGTLPVIVTAPADRTLAAGSDGTLSLPDLTHEIVASDNVAVVIKTQSPAAGTSIGLGVTEVTVTVSDMVGNSASAITRITVTDQSLPVVFAPATGFTPTGLMTGANGMVALPNYAIEASATDNVAVVGAITQSPEAGSLQGAGTTPVVLSARDAAGNVGTLSFNILVADGTAPTITALAPDRTLIAGANGKANLPDLTLEVVSTDNVAVATTTQDPIAGTELPPGLASVTISVSDAAGNAVSATVHIKVADQTAPVVSAPAGGFELSLTTGPNGTVALPDYAAQALGTDNVGVVGALTQSPPAGTLLPVGTTQLTLTARDAAENEGALLLEVIVNDGTAPTIAGTFSPLMVYAGTLLDYRNLALTTDNVRVASVTQSPPPDTATVPGPMTVTLTATDEAGNNASTSFVLIVRALKPEHEMLLSNGDSVAGWITPEGLPTGAIVSGFGVPVIDQVGNLFFRANWTTALGGRGSGIFTPSACIAKVGGEVPGIANASFKTLSDPVAGGGQVAFLATLSGLPSVYSQAVLAGEPSTVAVVARSGMVAPGAHGEQPNGGPIFKRFQGVAVDGSNLAIQAQLTIGSGQPRVTAGSDLGIWLKDATHALTLVLREGQLVEGRTIQTLVAFKVGAGSPGQGRGWLTRTPAGEASALARVTFTNGSQALLSADLSGAITLLSESGTIGATGSPKVGGASFASYGVPALNLAGTTAFVGSLTVTAGGPTKANARGIFADCGAPLYTAIARVTDIAGTTGGTFSVLKDPVLAGDDALAFPAIIKGANLRGVATTTLWWKPAGRELTLLAEGGQHPNDTPVEAQWKAFPSLAIVSNRGPIFSGTMVPGKGGVLAETANGVWAMDFAGGLRLLFRTGDPINGKTLKSFTLLNATVGSNGVTRSFNDNAQLVWLATFTDHSTAIVRTTIP